MQDLRKTLYLEGGRRSHNSERFQLVEKTLSLKGGEKSHDTEII